MTVQTNSHTVRLVWPQWQGAGPDVVAALVPEFPLETAQRGYSVGARVLDAILPASGPTLVVPVTADDSGLAESGGVFAREAVIAQLGEAVALLQEHQPDRVVTLGGECSVSVAPFTYLASRYDDLAVVWIDAHPDVGLPESEYAGYHAMAVSHILGRGDGDVLAELPAKVDASRVALVGLHSWTEDDFPRIEEWGLSTYSPTALADDLGRLSEWLEATGCRRVAVHLDVDAIDASFGTFGLAAEPGGLSPDTIAQIFELLSSRAEVVGVSVAEYVPRQAMAIHDLLSKLPLLRD